MERRTARDRSPGLIPQVAGATKNGWRIINIGESEAAFHRFLSKWLVRAASLAAQSDGFALSKIAVIRLDTVEGVEVTF